MNIPSPQCRLKAFTLMELLIAVSIVSLLCALGIPALKSAQESSQRAQCLQNLRQICAGLYSYASDHENTLPPVSTVWAPPSQDTTWGRQIWEYAGYKTESFKDKVYDLRWRPQAVGKNIFRCPSAKTNSTRTPKASEVNANQFSYGLNCGPLSNAGSVGWTSPIPLSRAPLPAATMMVAEVSFPLADWSGYNIYWGRLPHSGGGNFLYYDGHVEYLLFARLPTSPSDTFWSGH